MTDLPPAPPSRLLERAAYAVVVLWGMKLASPILAPILLSLLLAYGALWFPHGLMRRFQLRKTVALLVAAAAVGAVQIVALLLLSVDIVRMRERFPVYAEQVKTLSGNVAAFLSGYGLDAASLTATKMITPERLLEAARWVLPEAGSLLSNGLLIALLTVLLLVEMAEDADGRRSRLGERLAWHGGDIQRFVATAARTNAINATANLAVLLLAGVEYPVLWCVLYFFLNFIPSIGYLIALFPPTVLALLLYGWQRALVVAACLVVTNLVVDNFVAPLFMKRVAEISFLEATLALVLWAFVLGLPGAILAIPLTLALKKLAREQTAPAGAQ